MDNINCYLLSKKIKFVKDVQLTNPWVMGDGLHLTQVLINILMNAIKYTNENGSISFSIKEIEEFGNSLQKSKEDYLKLYRENKQADT